MAARRTSVERAVLEHVRTARIVVPHYGRKPLLRSEIARLRAFFRIEVRRANINVPVMTSPAVAGLHFMIVRPDLPASVLDYASLHEISHVIAAETSEPTFVRFLGPLPEMEDRSDLFALLGLLGDVDPADAESRIRELVPLDDRGWQVHRIPRLARNVIRMKHLVKEWED